MIKEYVQRNYSTTKLKTYSMRQLPGQETDKINPLFDCHYVPKIWKYSPNYTACIFLRASLRILMINCHKLSACDSYYPTCNNSDT